MQRLEMYLDSVQEEIGAGNGGAAQDLEGGMQIAILESKGD